MCRYDWPSGDDAFIMREMHVFWGSTQFVTNFPYWQQGAMSTQRNTAAEYIALSSEAYGLIVDTIASVTRSRLNYWNSAWQIACRPYASAAIRSTVRENFDRASELANLTLGELSSRVQRTADFSEKFLAQFGKLQDAARETYRDTLTSYVSTVDHVKDTSMSVNGVATVDQVKDASAENVGQRLRASGDARRPRVRHELKDQVGPLMLQGCG